MFLARKLMFQVLKLVFPAWKHRIISYKKLFLAKSTKKNHAIHRICAESRHMPKC